MSHSDRHINHDTARFRVLAFLFSILLLLGMGKAFEPEAVLHPEQAALAYQVHTHTCKAVLPAHSPDVPQFPAGRGDGGPAAPLILSSFHPFHLPGQAACVFTFSPVVKRCILYSCRKIPSPALKG